MLIDTRRHAKRSGESAFGDQQSALSANIRGDLVKHPRNARALFGLHESLLNQGGESDAAWIKRAFDDTWKDGEVTLTIEGL